MNKYFIRIRYKKSNGCIGETRKAVNAGPIKGLEEIIEIENLIIRTFYYEEVEIISWQRFEIN